MKRNNPKSALAKDGGRKAGGVRAAGAGASGGGAAVPRAAGLVGLKSRGAANPAPNIAKFSGRLLKNRNLLAEFLSALLGVPRAAAEESARRIERAIGCEIAGRLSLFLAGMRAPKNFNPIKNRTIKTTGRKSKK